MTFIETDRLLLRNIAAKDAEIMYDYRNNEICARYQRGQVKDLDGIVALVERRKDDVMSVDAPFMVAVALKVTDELVGEVVVMPNDGTISLGYTFSYRHHRKGYAFEALTALIDLLHERYPEWDFISFTEPQNEPSMALLKKLGYKDMASEDLEYRAKLVELIYSSERNLLQAFAQEADNSDVSNGHAMAAYGIIKDYADTFGVKKIDPAALRIDQIQEIAKRLFLDSKTD